MAATSWEEPAIAALRALPQVQEATADQCCFGLMARDPSGKMELVMKPTRFLSSAPLLLKELARRCSKAHPHTRLLGGRRARQASVAPSCAALPGSSGEMAWLCRLESVERLPGVRASTI